MTLFGVLASHPFLKLKGKKERKKKKKINKMRFSGKTPSLDYIFFLFCKVKKREEIYSSTLSRKSQTIAKGSDPNAVTNRRKKKKKKKVFFSFLLLQRPEGGKGLEVNNIDSCMSIKRKEAMKKEGGGQQGKGF